MTWIKETDQAIYLMEGNYYIEKIPKLPRPNGEKEVTVVLLKEWFSRSDAPGMMITATGLNTPEPTPDPNLGGHDGSGSGGGVPKPRVTLIPAHPTNYRARRPEFTVDTVVIHNTVYSAQSAINTFRTAGTEVSAHYIVQRNGEIVQMVEDRDCAFHAGNRDMNDRAIGIEHEATFAERGLTDIQEKASIALIEYLLDAYSIKADRVIPHRRVVATSCPDLIFPTELAFNTWVQKHFQPVV